ncbi:tRNA (guanosine(37)-N1)-methyltransferase TrmD [Arcanobacterium ihumii]|uniref:tRNA (guanosine(37)-N1)-methyltransferase TrmD n=1 Tax=Arcanobacterium ihumii TaxID=2138162 RepID=UPI001F257631|nr:tRNA (guanosine(37)-N1)-methyltransferase TrmD [Arcanobacterium ihumii]
MTMHFDIISAFPEFFQVLELSLVGKAQQKGIISTAIHDIRDWTHDVHRTVDDSPFGGGAGMVMKPDVWAEAIDSVVQTVAKRNQGIRGYEVNEAEPSNRTVGVHHRTVLAIPTPSGVPLTQRMCYDLAGSDHIILACGRYEGIDSRIAQYYGENSDIEVFEFSLGDYVLNGGEVASVALVEAVSRLVPGMVGNPESLVEESHGEAGLLEYPVFTRPAEFRGIAVPEVLTSGNHQAIYRWRRNQALTKTVLRRPDMIEHLDPATLDKHDWAHLASLGWFFDEVKQEIVQIHFRTANSDDVCALSAFAQSMFVDACPSEVSSADIDSFVNHNLTEDNFAVYVEDRRYSVYLAQNLEAEVIGYLLFDHEERPDDDEADTLYVYLSKAYLHPDWRGHKVFSELFAFGLRELERRYENVSGETFIWLGTHCGNKRAQRSYRKLGFNRLGTRTFVVGDTINKDITMVRPLSVAK